MIETPSWGYGDSGHPLRHLPQAGRPRDVFERVDDAAEVHRLTGTAGAVALHFPWDATDDYGALREYIEARGLRVGAVNPNLFQDPDYKLGSITHPDARVREKAVAHLLECLGIAAELGSTAQSLWFADGTNYPGQDDLRERRRRLVDALPAVYAELPADQQLLVEYKLFEPAFYATDLADWGSALLVCQKLGERARVLVDLGHHAQGVNIEQIVALLADEDRLGGFHFNNRKYADDDLIVGSVNPFELFLIFFELAGGAAAAPDHRPGAQRRGEGRGDGAQRRQPAGGLREGAARRPRRAARRPAGRRRARRPRGAARRLPHRRPPALRPRPRGARRRGGPDRRTARLRLRRAHRHRTRDPTGDHLMSTVTPLVDQVDDLWPAGGAPDDDVLAQLVLASNLLGADRAVSNFGGGNTSAKGTAIDHAGREVDGDVGQGLRLDLATMGPEHFTGLRLDEMLPLMERSEMSDEDMVAYLARCQLDPEMPRCVDRDAAARLRAGAARAPHAPGRHQRARRDGDGERLVQECFGDAAAWIPYIRPGFTLSRQVGEAARANPDLKLVVLAKHGLVVWGDTAEEAYRRTIEAINQAVAFVNERTGDTPRFGGAHPAAHKVTDAARAELLHDLLPAVRGAVSSERAKLLTLDTSARSVEFVSSAEAEHLVTVGAPCPDHLVHTKRVPLWISYDPDTDDADALRERIAERAEAFRADYREYIEAHGDESTVPADPDPRIVLIQHLGLVSTGTTTKNSTVSRDLYHRAIEVMAGAQALGEFVSLDAAESFAIEYWPLELYKLAQAPPPGELQGQVALVTGGAGGIGRAIGDSLADAGACVVAFDLDLDGAEDAVAAYGDSGLAVSGDVTSEDAVDRGLRRRHRDRFGGVDIVVSNAGVASSAAIEETSLAEWNRNHGILVTGYFLVAREAFKVLNQQGRGGAIVFVASKNAVVAGKNAAAYSSAKAAELHLARCLAEEGGAAGIRVNTVNPDAVLQGSRIWDSSWREERAASYGIEPDELEEHYRKRTTLR